MEPIKVRFQALVSFKYLATFSPYHLTPGQRRLLMLFGRHNDRTTTNKRIKLTFCTYLVTYPNNTFQINHTLFSFERSSLNYVTLIVKLYFQIQVHWYLIS